MATFVFDWSFTVEEEDVVDPPDPEPEPEVPGAVTEFVGSMRDVHELSGSLSSLTLFHGTISA